MPLPASQTDSLSNRLLEGRADSYAVFSARHRLLIALGRFNRQVGGLRALLASRIDLHPHQAFVAGTVILDPVRRYILADEVGLGKTIEAGKKQKVAIIGGGLSGLSCAKYLSDAGHEPLVLEARGLLGGKVSAWQDEDGDWIETGLHIFFGAYPNMMNMFAELDIEDRLQWKDHKMTFAMQERPGEFTSFNFPPNVPAPFNMAAAILSNTEMLTIEEKLRMVPGLLPMLTEGQSFIDAQDELSVLQFMRKYGMPERINEEIFVPMSKALDFIDPDKLSMAVVLTAMNRFINERHGSECAFLDGNQPERLCAPMTEYIEARGGKVHTSSPVKEIVTNEDGSVKHLLMRSGEIVVADEYISAMPVDIMKRFTPRAWSTMPFFRQMDDLEGIPVINIHMWCVRMIHSFIHPSLHLLLDLLSC
jgi:15-cis-phytoene desaturase